MTDVADLRIRAQTDGVSRATTQLNSLTQAGGKAERATDNLMGTLGRFASVAAIAGGAMLAFNKLLNTQRSFDVINAGLLTATGSAKDAAIAFEALQEFATKTPYDLQQVSESFVKLVNLGLTPSERALTSYGNTASAMGKDLNMMIEAVADASTGEMERLKEFGIKASKQGDQITFMFRGVKTTVANEASAIEDYLIALGENNFADSMSNRMKTLDGSLSNLGDAWDQMFLNISNNGVGERMAEGVNLAIDVLASLNDWLNSGQLEGSLDALGAKFGPWADDAEEAAGIVKGAIGDFTSWLNATYPKDMQILSDAWNDFPENIRAVIQIAAVHVAWFVEQVNIAADATTGYFKAMTDGPGGDKLADVWNKANAAMQANKANLADSVDGILAERDATISAGQAAYDAAIQKAKAAQLERDARRKANEGKDRLAGYGVDRPASTGGEGKEDKEAKAAAKKRQQEFERLRDDLQTEEEALQTSYSNRKRIIEENTSAESALRGDLMARLEKWRAEEAEDITEQKGRELRQLQDSLLTEEESIRASYEKRKQIVLDSMEPGEAQTKLLEKLQREKDLELAFEQQSRQEKRDRLMADSLTGANLQLELLRQENQQRIDEQRLAYEQELISKDEFERNKAAIERQYHDASMSLIRERQAQQMDAYGGMLGALGNMFGQFAQGQGKQAERMFKIQKALNIAQAIMSTATGIMRAQELGYPLNIAESIRVAAVGAMQVASIQSQKFSGAYDDGGRIPAGSVGMVGEKGMELVAGPAQVTSRRDTARMLAQASEGSGGGDVHVNITVAVDNRGNATASTTVEGNSTEVENAKKLGALIDERTRALLIKEQRQGGLLDRNSNRAA